MAKGFLDGYNTYDTSQGYGNRKKWENAFHARMGKEEAETVIAATRETPYAILNIPETASVAQIKQAFRTLINQWHPDKNPDNVQEAEAMSKKIIAAYSLLTQQ